MVIIISMENFMEEWETIEKKNDELLMFCWFRKNSINHRKLNTSNIGIDYDKLETWIYSEGLYIPVVGERP